jgi:serine/threonine protein kinase
METNNPSSDSFGCYSDITTDSHPKQFYRSASLVQPPEHYANYDLIAFLGLAQRLSVEFLPITWQSFRGLIGGGGQAKVNQASMNLRMSFAFKRFNHQSFRDPLQEIVQEMVVLACPNIRQHKYIIRLEGICWDFTTRNEVWPVLIFEKTHLGDLYDFARSSKGKSLSIQDRLDICTDIGIAIKDMHANSEGSSIITNP